MLLEVLTLLVVVKRPFSELFPIPLVVGRAWYLGCQSLIGGLALDQVLRMVGLFWLTTSCYSIAGNLLGLVTSTAEGRLDEPSLVPNLPYLRYCLGVGIYLITAQRCLQCLPEQLPYSSSSSAIDNLSVTSFF